MAYAFYKRELREDQLTALQPKWIAGIGMDIPITAGITSFPERQRAAAIEAKVAELDAKARHDIPLQVEACFAAATSLASGLKALDSGIELARESERLAEVRFKSGTGSSLEILKSQTDLETLLVRRLAFLEEYNRKLIELHAAAGNVNEYVAAYTGKIISK